MAKRQFDQHDQSEEQLDQGDSGSYRKRQLQKEVTNDDVHMAKQQGMLEAAKEVKQHKEQSKQSQQCHQYSFKELAHLWDEDGSK